MYISFNTVFFETGRAPSHVELLSATYGLLPHLPGSWLIDVKKAPRVDQVMGELTKRLGERGARVLVIDDPVAAFYPLAKEYEQVRPLLDGYLRAHQVPIVPAHDRFAQPDAEFWFYDICHLTPAGYRMVADLTWRRLLELGWLKPAASRP